MAFDGAFFGGEGDGVASFVFVGGVDFEGGGHFFE